MPPTVAATPKLGLTTALFRALARRCPRCGAPGIFANWVTLCERCPRCGLRLERGESDYFIGAYAINLVVVEMVLAAVLIGVTIWRWPDPPWTLLEWGGSALMIAGAIFCYPYSKTTWLAFDLVFRPRIEDTDEAGGPPMPRSE